MDADLYKRMFRAIFSEDFESLKKIAHVIIEYERKNTNIEKRADQLFENFYSELIDTLTHKNLKTDIAEQFEKKYVSTKAKVKRDLSREANAWLNDQKEF